MRIFTFHHILWQFIAYFTLSYLTVHLVREADAKLGHVGWAKSDLRTKQILLNIRTRLAEKDDQGKQQSPQDCGSGSPFCQAPKDADRSDEDEGDSDEERPTLSSLADRRKHPAPVKPKGVHPQKDVKFPKKPGLKDDIPAVKKYEKKPKDEFQPRPRSTTPKGDEYPSGKRDKEPTVPRLKPKTDDTRMNKFTRVKQVELEKPKKSTVQTKSVTAEADAVKKSIGGKKFAVIPKPVTKASPADEEGRRDKRTIKPDARIWTKSKKEEPTKATELKTVKSKRVVSAGEQSTSLTKGKRVGARQETEDKDDEDVKFPEDIPVVFLNEESVKSEQCKKHSRIYKKQLEKYKMWALMMYDASAKLPSGILQGNVNQYGDFDQCISVNATFKRKNRYGTSGIQGKYCLATVDVSTDSNHPGLRHAIRRSQSYGFVESNVNDPGHFIPRFTTVSWGVCIPSSCDARDLENFMKSTLDSYKTRSGLKFDVRVDEKNCVTKEDLVSESNAKTLITVWFYIFVTGVVVYATIKDGRHPKGRIRTADGFQVPEGADRSGDESDDESIRGKAKALIMAFSLKRNAKKLFIEGESEDSIDCIHGIKSIFTIMLYFAHKTIPLALTPFSNRVLLTEISNEAASVVLRGSMIYTDSFLMISGVLTSFNMCKEIHKNGRILWARKLIARYIRLTPALFSTLLFYSYIADSLGSGPIWNVVVKENSILCQTHMWRNLLYIQNFFLFEQMCAPQTHQLALDMQLSLVSPLLVYFLFEYDKLGIGILQAILMASSILRFTSTKTNELSIFVYHGMPVSQLYKTANLLYTQAIYRATPYVFGVIVGYYLRRVGKGFRLPKPVVFFGWITCACLVVLSFAAPSHLAHRNYEYDADEAAQYAALLPIAWSAALGWLIAACYLGYGGKINKWLSCKGFLIFSRISYSVYLLQFLVFSHIIGIKRTPETFSISGSLDIAEFIIVVTLSVATTLVFDIPTVTIKKVLLNEFPVKKPKAPEPAVAEEKDRSDGNDTAKGETGGEEWKSATPLSGEREPEDGRRPQTATEVLPDEDPDEDDQEPKIEEEEEVEGEQEEDEEMYEERGDSEAEDDDDDADMNYDRLEDEEDENVEEFQLRDDSQSPNFEMIQSEQNDTEVDFWADENTADDK